MSREPKAESEEAAAAAEAVEEIELVPEEESEGGGGRDPRALRFGQNLWSNLERISQVVAKSIDLAESSLALGARMVGSLGKLSEQQILDRVRETDGAVPGHPEPTPTAASAGMAPPEPPVERLGVANRVPLEAGSAVQVPFSLTNDSAETPKSVRVSLQDLVGQSNGGRLEASTFSVEPAEAKLQPLDFEKFVIRGTIPADAATDTYLGAIAVEEGDEVLTIPLRLSVA